MHPFGKAEKTLETFPGAGLFENLCPPWSGCAGQVTVCCFTHTRSLPKGGASGRCSLWAPSPDFQWVRDQGVFVPPAPHLAPRSSVLFLVRGRWHLLQTSCSSLRRRSLRALSSLGGAVASSWSCSGCSAVPLSSCHPL